MSTVSYELTPKEVSPLSKRMLADDSSHPAIAVFQAFFKTHWAMIALAGITIFGCIIRFHRLTEPTLWNDESLVFWRVCGTYAQMLRPLSGDGFPPLHYSLYWLIGHYTKLTPWTMRFIPAFTGTLTVPAMYFLARQMLPKSTSLVAALFTACSAFMLFYSRDAKMYPHTWFFVCLNVACLLWWFRTMNWTAWLGWIAAGCAMVGLHASSFTVLAVSPLLFFTQPKMHWKKPLLFLLGVVLIASGPIGYYTKFNRWNENVDDRGWEASGIAWVGWFNAGRTGPQYPQYTSAAFLTGWEWPRDDYIEEGYEQPIVEPLLTGPMVLTVEMMVVIGLGLLPWPLWLRPRHSLDPAPEPQWRTLFWISSLILLPWYGFYLYSSHDFSSPAEAWQIATQGFPIWFNTAVVSVLVAVPALMAIIPGYQKSALRLCKLYLATAAVIGIMIGGYIAADKVAAVIKMRGERWGKDVWTPRYLGFTWPAFGLIVACLVMRLPSRAFRTAVIAFICLGNLAMADLRLNLDTQAPLQQVTDDVWAAQPKDAKTRTYTRFDRNDAAFAGDSLFFTSGHYYMQMHADAKPMSPDIFKRTFNFRIWRTTDPNYIAADVRNNPQLDRIIVWEDFPPLTENVLDDLSTRLPGWKLKSADWSMIRNVWDWRERWRYYRREYVRITPTPTKK